MPSTMPRSGGAIASAVFLLGALSPAHAHVDTPLSLQKDGAITGLPEEYLPSSLSFERDAGRRVVGALLRLGGGEYSFPECMAGLFEKHSRIELSASWYHRMSVLPPYISIKLRNAGKHQVPVAFSLLFNLRTAQPLKFEKIISERLPSGITASRPEPAFERLCPSKRMADGWKRGNPQPKQ